MKGVHTYPPNGLLRFTCWSQISHLQELKLHEFAKVTITELAILTNLSESNQPSYQSNFLMTKMFLFQALFSVRTTVHHGRLFSTSYALAQKVKYYSVSL